MKRAFVFGALCLFAWTLIPQQAEAYTPITSTQSSIPFYSTLMQVAPHPKPRQPNQASPPKQPTAPSSTAKETARRFLRFVKNKQLAQARAMMAPRLQKVFPLAGLRNIWLMLQMRMGTFRKIESITTKPFRQFTFVLMTCQFSQKRIVWRLVLNPKRQIAGMQFLPAKPNKAFRPNKQSNRTPAYAKTSSFVERAIVVQAPGSIWKLTGTLTLPKGKTNVPGVVLVHGSGPHDQDETIGPNKVFRDIAWGLASQGIAVLRYTKRSKVIGQQFAKLPPAARAAQLKKLKSLDVRAEVIDDAIAALRILYAHKAIDKQRVFVLGHSLGAMMAPAITNRFPQAAGMIMVGSPSRSLADVVLDQFIYLLTLDGKLDANEIKKLKHTIEQVVRIKANKITDNTPRHKRLLGMSKAYLTSLTTYAPTTQIKHNKLPMMLLQGGRDYQVTMEDFNGWKRLLKGRKHTTLKLYPSLNHLFITGSGQSSPKEYIKPGHVSAEVIKDISKWLTAQRKPTTAPAKPTTPRAIASAFLKQYVRLYQKQNMKAVGQLYVDAPTTYSISSRGDRFVGFKAVLNMYKETFENVRFTETTVTSFQATQTGGNLIINARFSFTSELLKAPKSKYKVRSQGTLILVKAQTSWKVAHEHFSPILGIPRIVEIK